MNSQNGEANSSATGSRNFQIPAQEGNLEIDSTQKSETLNVAAWAPWLKSCDELQ
jgi:hypothetical protein